MIRPPAPPRPRNVVRPWPLEHAPRSVLDRAFDRLAASPTFVAGLEVPPFFALGVVGVAVGFVVVVALGLDRRVPVGLLASAAVLALAAFVGNGLLRRRLSGRESHVAMEGVLAALGIAALTAWWVGQPVWTVLDVFAPALGAFLTCGRIGCLLAGCCHGRPCALGIRYGDETHDALAGIRLFPVQLVEAMWLASISSACVALGMSEAPAGSALWLWLIGYATGRFVLDFARGDVRGRLGPLTETQWLALVVIGARVAYEVSLTPAGRWHGLALLGLASAVAGVGYATRRSWLALPAPALFPSAVAEWQLFLDDLEREARSSGGLADIVRRAPSGSATVRLSIDPAGEERVLHAYALRGEHGPLDEADAIALIGMIAQRLPAHTILRAETCDAGTFHYLALVDATGAAGSTRDDEPALVHLRAQAFAALARTIPAIAVDAAGRADPPLPTPSPAIDPSPDARWAAATIPWVFHHRG